MKTIVRLPGESLPESYYDLRYEVLRKPLGAPKGSERLEADDQSIHVFLTDLEKVVGIGRAHLIENNADGSVVDEKGQSVSPAFGPLCADHTFTEDDSGLEIPSEGLRPAVQIRAMATHDAYQDQGVGSKVLLALEKEGIARWGARSGWLQARIEAIPFYEANGWCCFDPEYEVPNIGPHVSMWKKF